MLYVVLVDKNYNVDTGPYGWACDRLKFSLLLPASFQLKHQGKVERGFLLFPW